MDYDVLILGGGIIGCSVAYELSKYNLNIALIEKDFDIADDVSFVNTAIVYDGSECKDNLMSYLENMGNMMLPEITKKLNVPFKRVGHLTIADNDETVRIIEENYKRAKSRGIDNIYLIDEKRAREIEPNYKGEIKKAMYSENIAVTSPYDLAIGFAEIAYDNGVSFRLEEVVLDIQSIAKGFKVTTNKNKFTCRFVINTTPGEHYTIDQDKDYEQKNALKTYYLLLNDEIQEKTSNIVVKLKNEVEFIIQKNTVNGDTLIGINSNNSLGFMKSLKIAKEMINSISRKHVKDIFYDNHNQDRMIIDDSRKNKGYIKVMGNHYGEVTIAPAVSKIICDEIIDKLNCSLNKNFVDKRREFYRFRELSNEERNELISLDKRYGKIVCLCNGISEGEIVDCIRRPLGARTVEGVKRRTGATFGTCHGAYCISKIINILARELEKKPTEIVEDSKNSKVLASRIKEFDRV